MNILIPDSAPEPSESEQVAKLLKEHVVRTWEQMKYAQSQSFGLLWRHPSLTPQEVCDALGSSASELFMVGGDLSTLILKYDPSFPPENWMPPVMPTFNQDGTVTIPPIPEPEPEPEPEEEEPTP